MCYHLIIKEAIMKRIMAFLTLLSLLLVFCACAEIDDGEVNDTGTVAEGISEKEPEDDGQPIYTSDDLPEGLNFDSKTINIASSDRSWWEDEVSVSDLNGELVNDAVYNRNLSVENRLGININNIKIPYAASNTSTVDAVKKSVLSGSPDYDIVFANAYVSLANSVSGIYHNLYDVDHINLKKDYWSQGVNEAIVYGDAQYAATGAIALSTLRFTFATIFNKKIFDDNSIPYIYDTVREGKWTLEYQYNLTKGFYQDKNGNNRADAGDLYGFITNEFISSDPYWISCDVPIIGRNADGEYEYVLDAGKLSDLVDKLLQLYLDPGTFCIVHKTADAEQDEMRKMFSEGRGAMVTLRLMEAESADLRMMVDPYGIVPMPKYDENQESYYTLMHDQFTVVSVTATVNEDDFGAMGALLEAMASESNRSVMPAYYESTLKYKYSSDPESWEMLDIVVENIKTDAGIVYTSSLSNPHHKLRSIMGTKINSVTSIFKAVAKVMERQVDLLNDNLAKLAD